MDDMDEWTERPGLELWTGRWGFSGAGDGDQHVPWLAGWHARGG